VRVVGFVIKKFVTTHGHTNVNFLWQDCLNSVMNISGTIKPGNLWTNKRILQPQERSLLDVTVLNLKLISIIKFHFILHRKHPVPTLKIPIY